MSWWLDWAKRNPGLSSGSYTEGRWKLLVHTTESSTFTPRRGSYFGHSGYPHLTNERDGTMWQHVDLDVAARALKNLRGGVQTNRSRVIQVENVAYAKDGNNALAGPQIDNLQRLTLEMRDRNGMEMVALPAGTIAGSARASAPQRMSATQWRTFSGIVGHRHAPENDHWDPGAFDLSRLLPDSTATPTPPDVQEDDDMIRKGQGPSQYIRNVQFLLNRFFTDAGGGPPSAGWLVKDGVAGDQTFAAAWEAVLRLSEPGFTRTGAVEFYRNGLNSPKVLESEGIDPALVSAIAAAAVLR